jgi:hypothetical protein
MPASPTLHIVKSAGPTHPWDLLAHQASAGGACVVVLIHDAVAARPDWACPTYVLQRDAQARGAATPFPLIDEERLVDLIWDAGTVVVW